MTTCNMQSIVTTETQSPICRSHFEVPADTAVFGENGVVCGREDETGMVVEEDEEEVIVEYEDENGCVTQAGSFPTRELCNKYFVLRVHDRNTKLKIDECLSTQLNVKSKTSSSSSSQSKGNVYIDLPTDTLVIESCTESGLRACRVPIRVQRLRTTAEVWSYPKDDSRASTKILGNVTNLVHIFPPGCLPFTSNMSSFSSSPPSLVEMANYKYAPGILSLFWEMNMSSNATCNGAVHRSRFGLTDSNDGQNRIRAADEMLYSYVELVRKKNARIAKPPSDESKSKLASSITRFELEERLEYSDLFGNIPASCWPGGVHKIIERPLPEAFNHDMMILWDRLESAREAEKLRRTEEYQSNLAWKTFEQERQSRWNTSSAAHPASKTQVELVKSRF